MSECRLIFAIKREASCVWLACAGGRFIHKTGLLGGVGLAQAISQGRLEEAMVRVGQLAQVAGWAFLNSLCGWIDAELPT